MNHVGSPGHLDGTEIKVRKLIFTTSNFISLSRIPAALLMVWEHNSQGGKMTILVNLCIIYIIFSDFLDGWMARILDQVSELGKIIDPVSDKLAALVLFMYAIYAGLIPLYLVYVTLIRDIFIIAGALYIRSRRGKVPMSVWSGKVAINVLAIYWLVVMYLPDAKQWHEWLLYTTLFMLAYSFIQYYRRYYKILLGYNFN